MEEKRTKSTLIGRVVWGDGEYAPERRVYDAEFGFALWNITRSLTGEGKGGRQYLANAFSLQMVPEEAICNITPVSPEEIPESNVLSIIGHPDTANVVSGILGRTVECNRASVKLGDGDVIYVAQLMGGRLPEGATTLPEGFELTFRKVVICC